VLYYYFWNIIKHSRQTTLRSIYHTFILVFSVKPDVKLDVFPCYPYRNCVSNCERSCRQPIL